MKGLQVLMWKSKKDDLKIPLRVYRATMGEMVNNCFASLPPLKLEQDETSLAISY